jgi:MoxR-like ATPase
VIHYIAEVVRRTRDRSGVVLGASPRAAIHLLAAAKAHSRLDGRSVPTREDVAHVAPYVLTHRIIVQGASVRDVVASAIEAAHA